MTGRDIIDQDIPEQLFPMVLEHEFVKKDQYTRIGFVGGLVARRHHLEFGRLSLLRNEIDPSETYLYEFLGHAKGDMYEDGQNTQWPNG